MTWLVHEGYRRAQTVTRAHARSFHFASLVLRGARRRAAFALYAACRRLDDLVDAADDAGRAGRLAAARKTVAALCAGAPGAAGPAPFEPAEVAALADAVARFALPEAPFQALISGMAMDLERTRYERFADLNLYCYRVAGTVGELMARILGARDPAALAPAADLGRAMQLTNILRDVREDLGRGRVYLPQDELRAFRVSEHDLAAGRVTERFRRLMRWQIARARRYYARAGAGIPLIESPSGRLAVRLMRAVYRDILRDIEARDYDVFGGRAYVPAGRKLALAASALVSA